MDRLFRQPRDLEFLLDRAQEGVMVYASDGEYDLANDGDRFMLRILTAAACKECDTISIRQRRKQEALRNEGKLHGGPRGFGECGTENGEPVSAETVAAERHAIKYAVETYLRGGELAGIAEEWTRRGFRVRSRNGEESPISYARVRNVICQPRIAGLIMHKGVLVRGRSDYEPIITQAQHELVLARLETKKIGRPYSRDAALTGGILTCGRCGRTLVSKHNKRKSRNGGAYVQLQYTCPPNGGCSLSIDAKAIEAIVRDAVVERLTSTEHMHGSARLQSELRELRGQQVAAESALADIADRVGRGEISYSQMLIIQPRLKTDHDEITARLAHFELTYGGVTDSPREPATEVGKEWDDGTPDDQRAMVRRARLLITVSVATHPRQEASERVTATPLD
jgi:hypothetical protein